MSKLKYRCNAECKSSTITGELYNAKTRQCQRPATHLFGVWKLCKTHYKLAQQKGSLIASAEGQEFWNRECVALYDK